MASRVTPTEIMQSARDMFQRTVGGDDLVVPASVTRPTRFASVTVLNPEPPSARGGNLASRRGSAASNPATLGGKPASQAEVGAFKRNLKKKR